MKEYPKINSLFKRDKSKKIIVGDYSIPEFKYLEDNIWTFTEKINGTNICIKWNGKTTGFGNAGSQIPSSLINFCINNDLLNIEKYKNVFGDSKADIYFEGYGKGIQETDGSKYDKECVWLSLIEINIEGWWLSRENCEDVYSKLGYFFGLVPIIGRGNLHDLTSLVRQGFKSEIGNLIAEGIVAKPLVEMQTRKGERIITKLKYLDFPVDQRGKVELEK